MAENTDIDITNENPDEEQENNSAAKTYTAEEVQKLLQAEADRRVNQALAKQKKDYEKKLSLRGVSPRRFLR